MRLVPRWRRSLTAWALSGALAAGLATSGGAPALPIPERLASFVQAAALASGALPHAQLALGVAASPPELAPGGWAAQSGVPWSYTYQYLAGGVNTGGGWQTWNGQGRFPIYYANAAQALGAIPVFSYYTLLQSNGSCGGCGEPQKDLAHLDDPTTMVSWYRDFATLMKRLGPGSQDGVAGYGGAAIVHVEPDLSGYAEQAVIDPTNHCFGHCSAGGNDPTHLHSAVASTGMAEVAAFPNTYQGYNDAILHLRDLYAPNVALAFHVSNWATLNDVGAYTGTDVDFAARE